MIVGSALLATGSALGAAPGEPPKTAPKSKSNPVPRALQQSAPRQPPLAAPNTPPPGPVLHCRKGQCNTRDIKVTVDDRKSTCTLKVEYDTVQVNAGNRGLNNQGVKLRWVLDDAQAKGRWFFYPGGVKPATNNGDFTDDGPDDAKKTYGLTDLNAREEPFSTKYTVVVMDKDRKAKCTGEASLVNKGAKPRRRQG
jgi:hypothetical protein